MINVCIIGAGRIAEIHAKNLGRMKDVNILYVVDKDVERAVFFAKKYDAEVSDLHHILQEPLVDAVLILSPTNTHAEYIELSAKASKHIFCEKPIDLDVSRAIETLNVVKNCNVLCSIGFNRRYDPQFNLLKESIINGKIGDVHLVNITSRDPEPPSIDYIATSGGIFKDMTIHDLDMARWLLGEEPTEIYAVGSCLIDESFADHKDIDTAVVILKTDSGKICQINNSRKSSFGYDQRIEVFGSSGMLQANNNTNTQLTYTSESGVCAEKPQYFFLERYKDSFEIEISEFINCVRHNKKPLVDQDDGLLALQLAEAALISSQNGVVQYL